MKERESKCERKKFDFVSFRLYIIYRSTTGIKDTYTHMKLKLKLKLKLLCTAIKPTSTLAN